MEAFLLWRPAASCFVQWPGAFVLVKARRHFVCCGGPEASWLWRLDALLAVEAGCILFAVEARCVFIAVEAWRGLSILLWSGLKKRWSWFGGGGRLPTQCSHDEFPFDSCALKQACRAAKSPRTFLISKRLICFEASLHAFKRQTDGLGGPPRLANTCLPAFLPSCLPAFLPSCLPAFLPSCLPAFLPSCLPAFLPSCLPAFLPSCLPAFLPSCLPAFLPSCLPAFLPSCLPAFLPSPVRGRLPKQQNDASTEKKLPNEI